MRRVSDELGLASIPENMVDNPDSGLNFPDWLDEVNRLCFAKIGLGVLDLADFNSWNCWNDGASPEEGLEELLEENDFDLDDMDMFE